MTSLVLIVLVVLTLLVVALLFLVLRTKSGNEFSKLIDGLGRSIDRLESTSKNEFVANRVEANQNAKQLREELSHYLARLTASNEERLENLRQTIESKLSQFQSDIVLNSKEERKELRENLDLFKADLNAALRDFGNRQFENFSALKETQQIQQTTHTDKLSAMSGTIEKSLKALQEDNSLKLEQMRATVDEKLEKTLETRLAKSFEQVSKNLESVQKGLGEMQQLATGVGDLKKVLTNVKTRGVLGEYQLANILEQLLTPEQYGVNVKTKPGSNALVEFAIKLPGSGDNIEHLWLPVDSKFPKEDYELLSDAYDQGNTEGIELHRKAFIKGIRKCAEDIAGKYIDPPHTTDFAILFLPFESLYAEVLRTPGLFETIQRECRVTITGPTTLSALLNSLQMGFRTLAISKRSSEVWGTLAAVKNEFGNFGKILDQTQKKIQEAGNFIDKASVRSRAIERKLKDVHLVAAETAPLLIVDSPEPTDEESDEG